MKYLVSALVAFVIYRFFNKSAVSNESISIVNTETLSAVPQLDSKGRLKPFWARD